MPIPDVIVKLMQVVSIILTASAFIKLKVVFRPLSASNTSVSWDATTENTCSSNLLKSSKEHQHPHPATPLKSLAKDLCSIYKEQLKDIHKIPRVHAMSITVSDLPTAEGPSSIPAVC